MEYIKLYLDDIRNPKTDGWIIVRSYNEFIKWIEVNGIPDEISFDHDLAHEHTKYYFDNGTIDYPYGYMPQNGFYRIEFPNDVYGWLIDRRVNTLPKRSTQSALSYDSVYFNENND